MSIHESVKTEKQYYLHNMGSAYFPIDRGLHRERLRERPRARERLCPSMSNGENTEMVLSPSYEICIFPYSIGDCMCVEKESERQ